jgi:hypothetical protein
MTKNRFPDRKSVPTAKLGLLMMTSAALLGCSDVHNESVSPNDPAYWYSGAPQDTPSVRAPGNERTYRPLGGDSY